MMLSEIGTTISKLVRKSKRYELSLLLAIILTWLNASTSYGLYHRTPQKATRIESVGKLYERHASDYTYADVIGIEERSHPLCPIAIVGICLITLPGRRSSTEMLLDEAMLARHSTRLYLPRIHPAHPIELAIQLVKQREHASL
ncbi:hypothetical protein F4860DRAFT_158875 [Xylaria cubensis]|nr:hypothetical protein F4860DRAFT_158875 [Xylaria cubensis]